MVNKPFSFKFVLLFSFLIFSASFVVAQENVEDDDTFFEKAMNFVGLGGLYDLMFGADSAESIDFVVEGSSVFVNDSNVEIIATPHTIHSGEWVVYNFTSKVYSGDVDMAFGFDTDKIKPVDIQVFDPVNKSRQIEYVCRYEFNYTTNPNRFWCFDHTPYPNGTYFDDPLMYMDHSFESGNIPSATAYWTEYYVDQWKSFSNQFNSINFEYEGTNKWWVNKNIPIVQDQKYTFRVQVIYDQFTLYPQDDAKYWFAIKPSSESLTQAVSNGHLYALDPWTAELSDGLMYFNSYEDSSGTVAYDNVTDGQENGTLGGNIPLWSTGKVGLGLWFDESVEYVTLPDKVEIAGDKTFCAWAKSPANASYPILSQQWPSGYYWDYNNHYIRFLTSSGTLTGNTNVSDGSWHHHCVTATTGNTTIYLDGVIDATTSSTLKPDQVLANGEIGSDGASVSIFGWIDEYGMWNRSLTAVEINDYYNGGDGFPYDPPVPAPLNDSLPVVVLNSPVNHYNTSSVSVTFNCTTYDDYKVENRSLYINGVINTTEVDPVNNSFYVNTLNFPDSTNNWTCGAFDNATNSTMGSTRFFTIDLTPPTIDIKYPTASVYSSVTELNYNTDGDYCWYSTDGGSTNSTVNACANFTGLSPSEGSNTWFVFSNDSFDNVGNDKVTFTLDTTPPTFDNLVNLTLNHSPLNYDIDATDTYSSIDMFTINWSSLFSINSGTGVIVNTSDLTSGRYWINTSVNDTLGNIDYKSFYVNWSNYICPNSIVNTTWSDWANYSTCNISNITVQQRYLVEYDENNCGNYTNVTYYEYQNIACVYVPPLDVGGGTLQTNPFYLDLDKWIGILVLFALVALAVFLFFVRKLQMSGVLTWFIGLLLLYNGINWLIAGIAFFIGTLLVVGGNQR